ncbi:MAG TPA: hypothetical protein VGO25_00180 [Rhodanobacteraceae bacterium]|jgi:hypothetical protein|nr:hypothetical protein [Rhodanobacteraceae bacterium]
MLRKLFLLVSISVIGVGSADAATLFLPGNSGIPDKVQTPANGCLVDVPTGAMRMAPYPFLPAPNDCLMSYSIDLPIGSTIDGVEVAYRDDSGAPGRYITAYLAENRIKPDMGAIAVAGANDFTVPTLQKDFMNMGPLSIPVVTGDIYWVQVSTHRVTEVDYVAVSYH